MQVDQDGSGPPGDTKQTIEIIEDGAEDENMKTATSEGKEKESSPATLSHAERI